MTLTMIEGGGLGRFLSALGPTAAALAIQLVTFAIVARGLGVVAFGQYAAILGLTAIGVELVGLGGADLLVRAVSRDPGEFSRFFGNMLILIAITLVPVVALGIYVAIYNVGTTIDPLHVAMAILGEVTIGRVAASIELAMVAHNETFRASCIRMATALVRLFLALGYFTLAAGLDGWIEAVLIQSILLSSVFVGLATWRYGRPRFQFQRSELRAGLAFGINQSARSMQGNLDRVVLARFASDAVLGAYAAGTRMMMVGLFPLQVMTRILYPQFFRHGEQGLDATRRFALRSLPAMVGTGVLAAIAVAGAGLFAPAILGKDFAASRHAAMLLALSLPIVAMQYLAADALTGAGYQHVRAVIYALAAVGFGVVLSVGAQLAGVNGLIAGFIGAHALLAVALWVTAFVLRGRRKEPAQVAA